MTRVEAIERLETRRRCAVYVDSEYVDSVDIEAINIAIEALAKVEAIQAVIDMPTLWEQDDRGRYTKVASIIRKDVKQ